MSAALRFLLLTDTEDDPLLVNLAQVTTMSVHPPTAGTAITFANREVVVVQESLPTIASWLAAVIVGEDTP
jgi:hypothetical protein